MVRASGGGKPFSSAAYSNSQAKSGAGAAGGNGGAKGAKGKGKGKGAAPTSKGHSDPTAADAPPTSRSGAGMRARRDAADAQDEHDVYTADDAPRRRLRTDARRFELSREERALAGPSARRKRPVRASGDDGDDDEEEDGASSDDMAARIQRAALAIAGPDALELASDEEVDSDAAWESSDEERWGGALSKWRTGAGGKASKGKGKAGESANGKGKAIERPLNISLDESDDEDDDAAEGSTPFRPNVAAFAGGRGAEDSGEEDDEEEDEEYDEDLEEIGEQRNEQGPATGLSDEEDDEDDDDDEDMDDDDMPEPSLPSESDSESDADAGPEAPADSADLLDFVHSLSGGHKRKGGDDGAEGEAEGEEAQIAAGAKRRRVLPSRQGPGGREDAGEFGAASAAKLSLADMLSTDPSLKSSAAALLKAPGSSGATSLLKAGTLAAPLPTFVTERLAREAAYAATKAEGDKWGGVMKRIKEAEHLSFPLQATKGGGKEQKRGGTKSAGDIIGTFQPNNDLESAVTALLDSANLRDAQIAQAEEDALVGQDLSMEEIAARRAELRYQRELLFRAEAKSKRVAKIKSKTFRKLARKRRQGDQMDLEDLQRLDPEAAEQEALKLETARAKERATLKHSAKGGRWAQSQRGQGETADRRLEMEEMLRKKELLKRKIAGRGADSDDSDEDEDVSDDDEDRIRTSAFDQLGAAEERERQMATEAEGKTKGIMGMKFMQRAMQQDKLKADAEADELRRQLETYGEAAADEDSGEEDATFMQVQGNAGRFAFAGNPAGLMHTTTEPAPTDTSSTLGSPPRQPKEMPHASSMPDGNPDVGTNDNDAESNPWLSASASTARSRKTNTVIAGKKAKASDKSSAKANKLKSALKTRTGEEDGAVEIDLSGPLVGGKHMPLEGDDVDSEDDTPGNNRPKAFKQRDLVAEAFAGDNVVEDFAAEKKRAIEADAPKEEDLTIPGWGAWAGKGVKARKSNRTFTRTIPGIAPAARKDFNRANVIISEKKDKKAAKYLQTDLPYPYTSAAQYEASFSNAVGSDWNTRATHQRETMPRVIKKPGAIINPVARLF